MDGVRVTRDRHSRRKSVLAVVVAVVSIAAVILGARVGWLLVAERQGLRDYVAEQPARAVDEFGNGTVVNPVQPWLSWYDRGVARHDMGDLPAAERDYRQSLEMAPESMKCRIVLNLAWAMETRADALRRKGDDVSATRVWTDARTILKDQKCPDTIPRQPKTQRRGQPKGSLEDQQRQTAQRLAQKAAQQGKQRQSRNQQSPRPDESQDDVSKARQLQNRQDEALKAAKQQAHQQTSSSSGRGAEEGRTW
ncbi:hypothetical protein FYJ43_11460 [Cutibacterium sp. WCA-380-WT-3A]|uniref:Tetratricopeptide repeat protein n=1 Tax=Cutibacterium porci TaxID=2605781 RepID=A0A7K0J9H6_9ACTN|nr:tetratricopeptide repeat protein [Cutibacterium porci]MSS46615.1 hypothetical protein [Cutibacterium porci]